MSGAENDTRHLDLSGVRKIMELTPFVERRKKFHAIDYVKWSPKQLEIFASKAAETLVLAPNQVGKTLAGSATLSYHLTGQYPEDWIGHRFTRPIRAWVIGPTALAVRDGPQTKLFGRAGVVAEVGTGMVPAEAIVDVSTTRGITDSYDTAQVAWGGNRDTPSTVTFKSSEMGREKFQSESLDFIWIDEECPWDIYNELLARVSASNGLILATFTPLLGYTEIVKRFLDAPHPSRAVIQIDLPDVTHISPERQKEIEASYPEWQRATRAHGVPMMGEGRVFATPEDQIVHDLNPAQVPTWWRWLWGVDFSHGGMSESAHPFAAILVVLDPSTSTIYVMEALKIFKAQPYAHAAAIRQSKYRDAPIAFPHDGHRSDLSSGKTLRELYKAQGLNMLPQHAQFATGGYDKEAGIAIMDQMFSLKKLLIARHLTEVWTDIGCCIVVTERSSLSSTICFPR